MIKDDIIYIGLTAGVCTEAGMCIKMKEMIEG